MSKPNFVEISQTLAEISRFLWFLHNGGCRHLGFWKIQNFNSVPDARGVILLNFIKIGRTVADKWWFNVFFQNGGRPPYWICWTPTGTTQDDQLVVFIVTPNLVKIDAVVSITWNFQYFARLAWKRLFAPPKLEFWGYFTPEYFLGVFHPKMERNINETSKGTSAGRNGSSGVLVMFQ